MLRKLSLAVPLAVFASIASAAPARAQNNDIEERAGLEGTLLRKGALELFTPENASSDPSSDYRRSLDVIDVFLIRYDREDLASDDRNLYDRCIAGLLKNVRVANLSAGGVGIKDRIDAALLREGFTDYGSMVHHLDELSRTALGDAGRAATLSDTGKALPVIDSSKELVAALSDCARDVVRTALTYHTLSEVETVNSADLFDILKQQKEAYDELIAIRDAAARNDSGVYEKLKDWKINQQKRFGSIIDLQQRALEHVLSDVQGRVRLAVDGQTYTVSQKFAKDWQTYQQSLVTIGSRLSAFEDLRIYASTKNDLPQPALGDTFVYDIRFSQSLEDQIVLHGKKPVNHTEAVIPLRFTAVLPIGSTFRIRFPKGVTGEYTVVGDSADNVLYIGDKPGFKLDSTDGVVVTYTHAKWASGRHTVYVEQKK